MLISNRTMRSWKYFCSKLAITLYSTLYLFKLEQFYLLVHWDKLVVLCCSASLAGRTSLATGMPSWPNPPEAARLSMPLPISTTKFQARSNKFGFGICRSGLLSIIIIYNKSGFCTKYHFLRYTWLRKLDN